MYLPFFHKRNRLKWMRRISMGIQTSLALALSSQRHRIRNYPSPDDAQPDQRPLSLGPFRTYCQINT